MMARNDVRGTILVMDANERNANLLAEFLGEECYDPGVLSELDDADGRLVDHSPIDLAIVDIDRFGSAVWDVCDHLRDRNIPFIVLSGVENERLKRQSRENGARSFVVKPVRKRELLNLIATSTRPQHQ